MKKVVIIGAGPAGLTAAVELLKTKKYKVIVLEESNYIGGISRTVEYKGNRMDLGGHRFFSKSDIVNDFWKKIMPVQGKKSYDDKKLKRQSKTIKNGPDPEKIDKVMLLRKRISRIYYNHKFFDYPISMKLETIKNLGFVKTFISGLSYLKSIVFKRKETSLENFYINRFGKKLYSIFFEGYTEKLWGRHPSKIDPSWGSQRVKGLSIIEIIKNMLHISKKKETSLIEEFMYPKYGPGQLWEEVSKQVENNGGIIYKNHKVIEVKTSKNSIKSVICDTGNSKKEITGDIFISSMPINDLIGGMSNTPKDIKDVALNLPYRDFVTVGLLVKKLKLKNETDIKTFNAIPPDCWIYVQDSKVKLGRIQVFNNWSPYMVKDVENTVWIGLEYFCKEGDSFWNMTDEESKKFAVDELVSMGIIDKDDVLDFHREKVKKAYPAYFDSYDRIDVVIDYLNGFDNLYCVGRNGQHRYNNMDHSMLTAIEAVKCITEKNSNKSIIWKVNTEEEYHEEK